MNKIIKILTLLVLIFNPNFTFGDVLKSNFFKKSNSLSSCMIYEPYLGVIKNIESIDIKSDKFEITDQNVLILNDNVEIDFPEGILKAGKARLDQENGLVNFKKGGELILKDYFFNSLEGAFDKNELFVDFIDGEAYINNTGLVINFEKLKGNLDNEIILEGISMTTCMDPSDGWQLNAESITLNNNTMRGYAKKVKVKAFDRTILRLPTVPFATSKKRMSGFLEPSISYSSDGLDFMIPYYSVLSETSDFTLALRNISERGFGFEANSRNLHGKNNLRNIDLIYFNNDKEYQSFFPSDSDTRWAFSINDSIGDKRNFWIDLDWSKSSDSLVLRDVPGEITSIGNQREQNLKQNIQINGVFNNFQISVSQEGYQTLNPILTDGYKKSPSIDITYLKNFKNVSIHEYLNYTKFVANNIHGFFGVDTNNKFRSFIQDPVEGERIYYKLDISNFISFRGYQLKSSIGLRGIDFNILDSEVDTNSVLVPTFKVDFSTLLIKKSGMHRHILKPRIFYGYVGHDKQDENPVFDSYRLNMMNQVFNLNRFTGMDKIGDQNFYTLSMEYKKRQMNMNNVSLRISQKFYLKDRKVFFNNMSMNSINSNMNMMFDSMDLSMMSDSMDMGMMSMMNADKDPIMIMAKWMPNMKTMFMASGGYSEEMKKFQMAGLTINHMFSKGKIGYAKRYTRMTGDFYQTLDYSEFYANLKIKDNIIFVAELKRDDENSSNIESNVGIGFENCCFSFRVLASDKNLSKYLSIYQPDMYQYLGDAWDDIIRIESKSRINFEFKLKGLNSSFEKVSRFMNNSLLNH